MRKVLLFLLFFNSIVYALNGLPLPTFKRDSDFIYLSWNLPKGIGLQVKKLQVSADGDKLNYSLSKQPQLINHHQVLQNHFSVKAKLPNGNLAKLQVSFQGCELSGVCFVPQQQTFNLHQSVLINIFYLFFLGIVLAFTPCALPIAPLVIASVYTKNKNQVWVKAISFLIGITVAYAAMGWMVGIMDISMQQLTQTPWVILIFASLSAVIALVILDIWPKLTQIFYSLSGKLIQTKISTNYFTSLVGAVTAIVATPCIAPVMFAALAYVSYDNIYNAALYMAAMGFGVALPATLAALFGVKINAKQHRMLQPIIAIMLLAFALTLYGRFIGYLTYMLGLIFFIVLSIFIVKKHEFKLSIIAVAILSIGYLFYVAPANGSNAYNNFSKFNIVDNNLQKQNLVYFHAKWCSSCKDVNIRMIQNKFTKWGKFHVDLTKQTSLNEVVQKKLHVMGPPTLVVLNQSGAIVNVIVGSKSINDYVNNKVN